MLRRSTWARSTKLCDARPQYLTHPLAWALKDGFILEINMTVTIAWATIPTNRLIEGGLNLCVAPRVLCLTASLCSH
jgi:hypothetical protein